MFVLQLPPGGQSTKAAGTKIELKRQFWMRAHCRNSQSPAAAPTYKTKRTRTELGTRLHATVAAKTAGLHQDSETSPGTMSMLLSVCSILHMHSELQPTMLTNTKLQSCKAPPLKPPNRETPQSTYSTFSPAPTINWMRGKTKSTLPHHRQLRRSTNMLEPRLVTRP
jgi:hypothetical protein